MKIRIGTRGSDLALAQARTAAALLEEKGWETEILVIKTRGDRERHVPFAQVGAPGVFVREIENRLLDGTIDLAVHSYKDLPSTSPRELTVAAVPGREDPADMLLTRPETVTREEGLIPLPRGAKVGTASARRKALLAHFRPDLVPVFIRGNVPTRIRKLVKGECDALLLAAAGIHRLAEAAGKDFREGLHSRRLDPCLFVPAPTQGALAFQVRREDGPVLDALRSLDSLPDRRAVRAERELLAMVEGGCQVPFGAWCRPDAEGLLTMTAFLQEGAGFLLAEGKHADPYTLAETLWARLNPERGQRK